MVEQGRQNGPIADALEGVVEGSFKQLAGLGVAECRRLVLPMRVATWSLTSLQQRLVKTGGRLIKHARYYWLLLAESHLTRRLFAGMLRKIAALPSPAG